MPGANTRDPAPGKVIGEKNLTGKANQVTRGFKKVNSRDPAPNKAVREKT